MLTDNLGYQPSWWSLLNYFSADARRAAFKNLACVGILDQSYVRADSLFGGQRAFARS